MKIVKVIGGLGNQMFQYAFYKSLAEMGHEVKLDLGGFDYYHRHNGYELDKVFNLSYKEATREEVELFVSGIPGVISNIKKRFFNKKAYVERDISYKEEVFNIDGEVYYEGYWQSEKYFQCIRDLILKSYKFRVPLDGKNLDVSQKIQTENSVGIHVRRGDYITNYDAARLHGGICDTAYYMRAVKTIGEKVPNPTYYIFSDDKEWVKENLRIGNNLHYVDWNYGEDSYRDMQLMSMCKHNIIANSSFSWWGAWLNRNPEKIIVAPLRWFNKREAKDIVPQNWLRV